MCMSAELDTLPDAERGLDRAFGVGWIGYALILATVGVCTALNFLLSIWLSITDLAMIYLLGVVIIAAYCRWTLSVVGAALCFLAFDFFFVPPVYTLRFANAEHLMTGIVLLVVGLVTSVLASRLRQSLQLANRAAMLASEEQLRNSVLASLSHDLRTPLSVIAGSASTLKENRSRLSIEEQDQLLATIFEQSRTMSADVGDLLEMTRLHAGPIQLDRQWYPLEELVGAAIERCKSALAQHHVSVEIPADAPLVCVDGVLIEKLFVNLLDNAAKYTLPGSRIGIVVTHSKSGIDVIVEDDGPGLPEGFETELFKKFSRAHREGSLSGSGLGLSICRAIAHLHEMNLVGRNRPLGGAQFALSIPYRAPPAPPEIEE